MISKESKALRVPELNVAVPPIRPYLPDTKSRSVGFERMRLHTALQHLLLFEARTELSGMSRCLPPWSLCPSHDAVHQTSI